MKLINLNKFSLILSDFYDEVNNNGSHVTIFENNSWLLPCYL